MSPGSPARLTRACALPWSGADSGSRTLPALQAEADDLDPSIAERAQHALEVALVDHVDDEGRFLADRFDHGTLKRPGERRDDLSPHDDPVPVSLAVRTIRESL
jgi:hypothetical protein